MDNETVGILWFKNKNQYLSYLHALTDANELPRSYTAWLMPDQPVYLPGRKTGPSGNENSRRSA